MAMTLLLILRGWWRMKWNLCPRCNSDAPMIDMCHVCSNNREMLNQPQEDVTEFKLKPLSRHEYKRWIWHLFLEDLAKL